MKVRWKRDVFIFIGNCSVSQLITTVLIIFTGLIGSLYTSDIATSFPFPNLENCLNNIVSPKGEMCLPPNLHFSSKAGFFWIVFFVTGLFFVLNRMASEMAAKDANRALIEQTKSLENVVRTLPPEKFLETCSFICRQSYCALKAVSGTKDKKQIDIAIRVILSGILKLSKLFEHDPKNAIYGANIMTFVASSKMTPQMKLEVEKKLYFIDPNTDILKLYGFLYLDPALSTNSKNDDPLPDSSLSEFYLPIPHSIQTKDEKYLVLPGAPLAYLLKEANGYLNAKEELVKWMNENSDFAPSVIAQVRDYFKDQKMLKSFFSIPILLDKDVIAVLNIHKNEIGFLREDMQFESFRDLINPLLIFLYELLNERQNL